METPMADAEENLYVANASCDMYSADEDSESSFGKLCDDKFVVFHMQDIKCSRKTFTSNYFTSSLFDHERDASNSCDRGEGVCTKDLMVSDTPNIANFEFNGSVHMLPFAGTGCDQQNSLVDKDFVTCGEAMLPNGYLLDKHIVEPFVAIDVKLANVKELEAMEPLDEQVLDDELEEDDPLTWQVTDPKVASTYANDVEGSLEVLESGLASVGILACSYAHDYAEGIAIYVIHVFDMVYEKSFDVKEMPSVLSRLWAFTCWLTRQGQGQHALDCFDMMQSLNVLLDGVTYVSTLKACAVTKALRRGEKIHDDIVRQGLIQNDAVLDNGLADLYVKCGLLRGAHKVFSKLPVQDVALWILLIGGLTQEGKRIAAFDMFERICEFRMWISQAGSESDARAELPVNDNFLNDDSPFDQNVQPTAREQETWGKCSADKLNAAKDTVSTSLLRPERRADDDSPSMVTTTPGHNDSETTLATAVGNESKNHRDNDNLEKNDNITGLAVGTTSSLGADEGKSLHTNEGIEPRSNAEAPFHNAQENVKEDKEYYDPNNTDHGEFQEGFARGTGEVEEEVLNGTLMGCSIGKLQGLTDLVANKFGLYGSSHPKPFDADNVEEPNAWQWAEDKSLSASVKNENSRNNF
ncbi:hypothetical protein L7F22_064226 [Adiantum nelumboides]|nr:hypothetical protein [Adiantum nelumboides]